MNVRCLNIILFYYSFASMRTILFDTRSKKSASELPDLLGTTTIPLLDSNVFGIVVKKG